MSHRSSSSMDYRYTAIDMKGNRVPAVDFLRFFSLFTIVLMHLIQMMNSIPSKLITLSKFGGTGVHVFFLCSGLVLYLSFLSRPVLYFQFLKKKFIKIYIPYILVIFVSFFIPWMYVGNDKITALLSHVFLFKMFVPRYIESFGVQFWFISTLFQLYLVFIPMCILKAKIKNNRMFFGIFMCVSIAWWIFCLACGITDKRIWNSFFLQYIWEFALGMVLADLIHKGNVIKIRSWILILSAVFGISLEALMALTSDVLKIFNDVPALIGFTSLALLVMKISFIKNIGIKLSKISYEYFLVHILVFVTAFHIFKPQRLIYQIITGLIALALTAVISYLYHLLLQKSYGIRQ